MSRGFYYFFLLLGMAVVVVWASQRLGSPESGFFASYFNKGAAGFQALVAEIIDAKPSVKGGLPSAVTTPSFSFSKDLYFGLRASEDVKQLQRFLTEQGFYRGPITGNFYALTLAAVKTMQTTFTIWPPAGFVGPKTRLVLNQKLAEAQEAKDLAAKADEENASVAPPVSTSPVPSLPAATPATPLESFLVIRNELPSRTLTNLASALLAEFSLIGGVTDQKVAITKIKFTNSGTLRSLFFTEVRLINSRTKEILAKSGSPINGEIEFALAPDDSKGDRGLMVTGGIYAVEATLRTSNAALKPTIQLDVLSADDVTAKDFSNLDRSVSLASPNLFPVIGSKITLPY